MWNRQHQITSEDPIPSNQSYEDFVRQAEGADALYLHNWSEATATRPSRPASHGFRFPWSQPHDEMDITDNKQSSSSTKIPAETTWSQDSLLNHDPARIIDTSYHPLQREQATDRSSCWQCFRSFQHLQYNPYTAMLLFLALGFGSLTGVYASGTARSMLNARLFSSSPSNSLLTLRLLSEASTLLLWGLYLAVLEEFQWATAASRSGVNVLQYLTLDMGTGFWGLLRMVARLPLRYKASAIIRILLIITVPIPGILIMSEISINQLFFPVLTHEASAGLAVYNSSLTMNLSTKWATALCVSVGNPVWNSRSSLMVPPLLKGEGGCVSASKASRDIVTCDEAYFMGGGIEMVAPQLDQSSHHDEASVIVVPRTQGYHIEFGEVPNLQSLLTAACAARGDESGAVYWCLSKGASNEFLIGGVYCPLEIQKAKQCISDVTWTQKLTLSSSIFIYRRSATVYYHRSNFTILKVSDMSPAIKVNLSAIEVFLGLNAVSVSSNNCSSISHYAATILPASDNQNAALLAVKETRAVFGLMLHYFHDNFVGAADSVWILDGPRPGLAADMYTTASFARPAYQATASRRSLWLFVGVQSVIVVLCIISIGRSRRNIKHWPVRSGYPSLDFAVHCLPRGGMIGKLTEMRLRPSRSLPEAFDYMRVWAASPRGYEEART